VVRTADGKQIDFTLDLSLQSGILQRAKHESFVVGDASVAAKTPLVI